MIKKPANLVSGKSSPPGLQMASLLMYPHKAFLWFMHEEREKVSSLGFRLIRIVILLD